MTANGGGRGGVGANSGGGGGGRIAVRSAAAVPNTVALQTYGGNTPVGECVAAAGTVYVETLGVGGGARSLRIDNNLKIANCLIYHN